MTRISGALLLVATSLIGGAASARAAEADQPTIADPNQAEDHARPAGFEDIVVTARRVEERSLTVPVAITAFSANDLARQQIRTSDDLGSRVPALRIEADPTRSNDFQIRGVGRTFQGDSGVVTYIAEVPQQLFGSPPLFDIQSVQVLKGPQGTLFGKNTTGGAVLIEPKRPNDNFEGFVSARYGNYATKELTGGLNVPISEQLQVRIAAQFTDRAGQQKNISGPDWDTQNRFSGRMSVLAKPADWLENYTLVDYYYSKEYPSVTVLDTVATCAESPTACLYSPPLSTLFGVPSLSDMLAQQKQLGHRTIDQPMPRPKSTVQGVGIANHTVVEAGDITIKNIFSYRHVYQVVSRDLDGTKAFMFDTFNFPEEKNQLTNELQFRGTTLDDKLNWVVGGFYSSHDAYIHHNNFYLFADLPSALLGLPPQPTDNNNHLATRSKAVFSQLTYDLSGLVNGLKLTGGFRYTWEKRRFTGSAFAGLDPTTRRCSYIVNGVPLTNTDPATCIRDVKLAYKRPTWNVNLEYAASRDLFFYATTRRGFKGGSFNVSARDESTTSYAPETLTDIEVGIKNQGRLGGIPYRFNVSAFNGWFNDQQSQQSVITGGEVQILILNASKATIKGFEVEASIEPVRGLQFGGFYGLTDGKYKTFAFEFRGAGSDYSGRALLGVPKTTASANVTYSYDGGANLGDLSASLFMNYRSSIPTAYNASKKYGTLPSYHTFDASAEWRDVMGSKVDLRIYCKNIANKDYWASVNDGLKDLGTATVSYGDPRTYGVEMGMRF